MPAHFPYLLKGELQQRRPELVGRAIAMRTSEWTYVYGQYEGDELYDRRADPGETTSLAPDAAHAATCSTLRDEVLSWLVETSDVIAPERDPRMDPELLDQFLGQRRSELPA